MNRAEITQTGLLHPFSEEHPLSGGKSLESIFSNFKMEVISEDDEELIIDMIGLEAPIANALRRIMISEVATMAIEDVHLYQNTSPIPDEMLANRLGLIPIKADPRLFGWKRSEEEFLPSTSICFRLHKVCRRDADGTVINHTVYSGDLVWQPIGDQSSWLGEVRPVHEDIIIAKLGVGQEIECDLYCEKGIGKVHTKWSPVCTAFYRLLPIVELKNKPNQIEAKNIASKCAPKVFDIEDGRLAVTNPRACTTCRECIREDDRFVALGKKKDHFICKV